MAKRIILSVVLCGMMVSIGFGDVTAQLDEALKYKQLQDFDKAEAIYQQIIADNPSSNAVGKAKIGLGRMYKKLGRSSEAETLYQEVLASDAGIDRTIEARKHLAILYIATDRDSDAQSVVNELKSDFPGHLNLPSVFNAIARSYQRYGKGQSAKDIYQVIKADFPGDYYAFLAHKKLVALGAATEINAAARTAIDELAGKIPHVTNADVALPDIGEVLSDINGLVTNHAGYPYLPGIVFRAAESYHAKASALEAKGLAGEAEAFYQKAASIYDVFVEEFSDSASEFSHLAGFAYDYAGYCYYELGDYPKSINSYQKLVDNCPQHDRAWNGLAMMGRNYEKMKKAGVVSVSQARTNTKFAYEQLVTQYPDCKAARMASNWLSKNNSK